MQAQRTSTQTAAETTDVGSRVAVDVDARAAYRALASHDTRFDGRFVVGVTTTRIYCRPVCRVRLPRANHCLFFNHAALAERQGFRPCMRCRPELAPGLSLIDSPKTLAQHAAVLLERAALRGEALSVPTLAMKLGVTDRHLRRIFAAQHGVSPLAYLTTQRLLFAKRMLSDTTLPVSTVAALCGFGSARRFEQAFAAHYRMPASALRQRARSADEQLAPASASFTRLKLNARPPYDVAGTIRFFARRALKGVESVDVDGCSLVRTWEHGRHRGWIRLQFHGASRASVARTARSDAPHAVSVALDLSDSLVPVLGDVLVRARHALDLDAHPSALATVLALVPVRRVEGLRLPGAFDPFETLVRVVLGQQVSVAAANTLAARLVAAHGMPLETPWPGLTHTFPNAQRLASLGIGDLASLGIVQARAHLIATLADMVASGKLDLTPTDHQGIERGLQSLAAVPGVGAWTQALVAMRVFAWPDAYPNSDVGVLQALGLHRPSSRKSSTAAGEKTQAASRRTPAIDSLQTRAARAELLAEPWRPWRSYAVMQLWQSLETP